MTVSKNINNKDEVIISIADRFDFSLHQLFKDAYANTTSVGMKFVLDLSKTTYMDSSALGMILLLREHAEKCSGHIVIRNPSPSVGKILDIAQFHKLMTIES